MFTTGNTNIPFHYVSASSFNTNYVLVVEIDKALETIRSSRGLLLTTPFMVGQGEYIRPVECDDVGDIVNEIRRTATTMTMKLRAMDDLTTLSSTTYHKLLMYLYSASDKSQKLDELLKRLRSNCSETINQQHDILAKIQNVISIVIQTCEKIEAETEEILDSMLLATN